MIKLNTRIQIAFSVALALLFAASFYGLWNLNRTLISENHTQAQIQQQERTLRELETDFKVQVQEWKNVLLRGHKAEDRAKYWKKFEAAEASVLARAESLVAQSHFEQVTPLISEFVQQHNAMGKAYRHGLSEFENSDFTPKIGDIAVRGIDRAPAELLSRAANLVAKQITEATALSEQRAEQTFWISLGLMGLFATGGILIAIWTVNSIQKLLGADPTELQAALTQLSHGHLDKSLVANGLATGVMAGLEATRQQLCDNAAAQAKSERQTRRIFRALDRIDGSLMVAESHGTVIYINESLKRCFGKATDNIRIRWPDFDIERLVGENINDVIQKITPEHVDLSSPSLHTEVSLGELLFTLKMNKVLDVNGEAMGTVVEWTDRTSEAATEREIYQVVKAASQGDLTARLQLNDKQGFFRTLSENINELVHMSGDFLGKVQGVMGAIAQGDLTRTIQGTYDGSFARLQQDCNSTVTRLMEIVGEIQQTSAGVEQASRDIKNGNLSLKNRTQEQVEALEKTSAAMEQMRDIVETNARSAQRANDLAHAAHARANRGGDVVKGTMDAMRDINTASSKIADIIGVINEIAFQTNLLALNAAVEAARAGEDGKGFAVVAAEVRNLAQRSATAAKEIEVLIEDTVQKVELGSAMVTESGDELNKIVEAVDAVTSIVAGIASASRNQSDDINKIAGAITQLDGSTQQNAGLVNQVAESSGGLEQQALSLNQLGEFFVTTNSGRSKQPARHDRNHRFEALA